LSTGLGGRIVNDVLPAKFVLEEGNEGAIPIVFVGIGLSTEGRVGDEKRSKKRRSHDR
jgi:hypothetical protein